MMWTRHAIHSLVARTGRSIRRALEGEDGVTAIEYGIIVAGISITIIATVSLVGENLVTVFENIAEALGGKCC